MRVLVVLGLALVAGPISSHAALDASSPIVCAMVDVFDCSGEKCFEVDSQTVGVPDLVRVDAAAKTIGALDPELEGSLTKLDSLGVEEGKRWRALSPGIAAWCSPSTRRRAMRSSP